MTEMITVIPDDGSEPIQLADDALNPKQPVNNNIIDTITTEATRLASSKVDSTTLYNEVRKLCMHVYSSDKLNTKAIVQICSGLIALYQMNKK